MREISEISADLGGKAFHSSVSDLVMPKMIRVIDENQNNTHKQNQFLSLTLIIIL